MEFSDSWFFGWVAMILIVYGFVVLLFLLSVRADRLRHEKRFALLEAAQKSLPDRAP